MLSRKVIRYVKAHNNNRDSDDTDGDGTPPRSPMPPRSQLQRRGRSLGDLYKFTFDSGDEQHEYIRCGSLFRRKKSQKKRKSLELSPAGSGYLTPPDVYKNYICQEHRPIRAARSIPNLEGYKR